MSRLGFVCSVHCADRWRLGGRGEESVTLRAEKKREKEGKNEKNNEKNKNKNEKKMKKKTHELFDIIRVRFRT